MKAIWSHALIVLFAGFVICTVIGTSQYVAQTQQMLANSQNPVGFLGYD